MAVCALVALSVAGCSGDDPADETGDGTGVAAETGSSTGVTDATASDSAAASDDPTAADGATESAEPTGADNATESAAPAGAEASVAEPLTDDAWWDSSLCSELDLARLQEDSGLGPLERQLGNGFGVGVPPVRECTIGEEDSDVGGQRIEIGVSLLPVDEAGWQQVVDHEKSLQDDPEEVHSVGDQAFITASLGKILVGDRVVTVDTMDSSALSPEQLEAVLQDVAEVAEGAEIEESHQVIEGCQAGDEAAAALLGEEPTVRADFYHPAFETPTCVWATATSGVQVMARPVEDAAAEQEGAGYDEPAELGRGGGMYLEDGSPFILSWASEDNAHDVTMEFVEGQEVAPEDAVALGKALEGLYGAG